MEKSFGRKQKHVWTGVLVLFFAMLLLPVQAKADMGPKPAVYLSFEKTEEEGVFYVTLLGEKEEYGPWSKDPSYQEWMGEREIWEKFDAYEDKDGFYFWGEMQKCSETEPFAWEYYAPERFKPLLYFPETDRFAEGDRIFERYAFRSYFSAEKTAEGITLEKQYPYGAELAQLLLRIVLTIGIELLIALAFRFWSKRELRLIALTNVVTQILLNVGLHVFMYFQGYFAFLLLYALLEIVVMGIEGKVYLKYMGRSVGRKPWVCVSYAVLANFCSFLAGTELVKYFYMI